MKGLVFKDFICLKRNFKMFLFVTLGVIAVAVMFVLSSRFGNVADMFEDYDSTDTASKSLLLAMIDLSLHSILLIPIAFVANVTDCFLADEKADFYKNLFCMPLNYNEIVGARYVTLLMYIGIGLGCSLISAISICACSETLVFKDMISAILFFGGLFLTDVCIGIPFVYLFGSKTSKIISAVIIALVFGIGAIIMKNKMAEYDHLPDDVWMVMLFNNIKDFIIKNGIIVMAVAVAILVCSYFASVLIVKKKRGEGL